MGVREWSAKGQQGERALSCARLWNRARSRPCACRKPWRHKDPQDTQNREGEPTHSLGRVLEQVLGLHVPPLQPCLLCATRVSQAACRFGHSDSVQCPEPSQRRSASTRVFAEPYQQRSPSSLHLARAAASPRALAQWGNASRRSPRPRRRRQSLTRYGARCPCAPKGIAHLLPACEAV